MSLTFGTEQDLLDKLSGLDRELARIDLDMFGMYCIEEVDGVVWRVDPQSIALVNGKIWRRDKIEIGFDERCAPHASTLVDVRSLQRKSFADSGMTGEWARMFREALLGHPKPGTLPIWKKQDPGAL